MRERYGDRVEFYALTIAEFVYLADRARLSYADAAARLRDAGVHWITGGGSEILTEDFRKRHAKFKYTVRDYFEAQRAIVEAGLKTTATMVIGFDETLDERLEHLQRTRDFQDETGGLFSFLCWTYKPYGTAFGGREISAQEYWRHIALSRIFLDNVKHVRTSVLTQNEDAFRALDFGADDFDLPIEDEVTQKAGATIELDLEALLAVPRSLGYTVEYRRAERPAALTRPALSRWRRRRNDRPLARRRTSARHRSRRPPRPGEDDERTRRRPPAIAASPVHRDATSDRCCDDGRSDPDDDSRRPRSPTRAQQREQRCRRRSVVAIGECRGRDLVVDSADSDETSGSLASLERAMTTAAIAARRRPDSARGMNMASQRESRDVPSRQRRVEHSYASPTAAIVDDGGP